MNLTTDDLFTLIGIKTAELYAMQKRVAELEQAAQQLFIEQKHAPNGVAPAEALERVT